MQVKLHKKDVLLQRTKRKAREKLEQEVLKRQVVTIEVSEMNKMIDEMSDEVSDAKKKTQIAIKKTQHAKAEKRKVTTLATKHLLTLKELKSNLHDLKDKLADESQKHATLEQMSMVQLQIKRQRQIGC
jgi:hypothetical protein